MTEEEKAAEAARVKAEQDATVAAARDAERGNTDPLAPAVRKIAEHTVAAEQRSVERQKAHERASTTRIDEVAATVRDGFAHVGDRLDAMGRGGGGIHAIEDVTAPLKAAMTDAQRANMGEARMVADDFGRKMGEDSPLAMPEMALIAGEWFQCATQLQSSKFAHKAQLASRLDVLTSALESAGGVTKASLQEDTTTEGGFLVPTIVANEIMRQVLDAGDIFPRARQWPMTTKTTNVPNEATACSVNWIAEEGTLTAGEPVFGQTVLTADKLAGRATMSLEVVQDSPTALLPYLLSIFTEAMARELDKELVIGDGTTPAITGITAASGVVAITSGTAAGRALTYALLVQAYLGASEKSSRQGAAWIMSKAGHKEILELVDGNSRPLLKLDNLDAAPSGTLFGSPIIVNSALGGSGTLDDTTNSNTTIVYGPLSSLIAATRAGMSWDVTDQVNWSTYQMDARLIGRFGGAVGVPKNFVKLTHLTTA